MAGNEEFQPSDELVALRKEQNAAWMRYQEAKMKAETEWYRLWEQTKALEQREIVMWNLRKEGVIK